MKIKSLVMNTALNTFGMYAALSGNGFTGNIFFAVTIMLLIMGIIVTLSVIFDPESILTHDMKQRLKYVKFERALHLSTEIPLIMILFGCGWWFSGFVWFFIHIVVNAVLKVKIDELEREVEK